MRGSQNEGMGEGESALINGQKGKWGVWFGLRWKGDKICKLSCRCFVFLRKTNLL